MKRIQSSRTRRKHNLERAGVELRTLRERRHLTMRQVHHLSRHLSSQHESNMFEIFPSRLHLIEKGKHIPCLHRIYALARIYRTTLNEIFRCYGINGSRGKAMPRLSANGFDG